MDFDWNYNSNIIILNEFLIVHKPYVTTKNPHFTASASISHKYLFCPVEPQISSSFTSVPTVPV